MEIGQKVKAKTQITECGHQPGDPKAVFPSPLFIHAENGDVGFIEGADDGCFTVRFEKTGTACTCAPYELECVEGHEN